MNLKAYYNEIDPNAAQWLRELIKEGVITDGEVDERSIEDVLPADLRRFDRCHFFAGVGIWDHALNRAEYDANGGGGQVFTGSCPCQPFSAAGKGVGFDDERHLWPAWFHLIEICQPYRIFGEQVSSKDGLNWLDLVSSDLEGIGYSVGALDIPSASVGGWDKRQRFYFVADSKMQRIERIDRKADDPGKETRIQSSPNAGDGNESRKLAVSVGIRRRGWRDGDTTGNRGQIQIEGRSDAVRLADDKIVGCGQRNTDGKRSDGRNSEKASRSGSAVNGTPIGMAVTDGGNTGSERQQRSGQHGQQPQDRGTCSGVALGDTIGSGSQGRVSRRANSEQQAQYGHIGRTSSIDDRLYTGIEWIYCRDGKYRPVAVVPESELFESCDETARDLGYMRIQGVSGEEETVIWPLIEKGKARMMRIRGYGNGLNADLATEFIKTTEDIRKLGETK